MGYDGFPPYIDPTSGEKFEFRSEDNVLVTSDRVVPVVGQISRFVVDQGYAGNFGFQWNKFKTTQLDSYTGFPTSEERLRAAIGRDLSALRDCMVLELGCGAGRFTELLLRHGARVDSVDLSIAVEANRDNCPISNKHRITQANLLDLPFPYKTYDYVLCLGVVQHTPDSYNTIREISQFVKPGGHLVFDHYRRLSFFLKRFGVAYWRKKILSTSEEDRMAKIEDLVQFWFPVHKRIGNRRLAQRILSRISPISNYFHIHPYFTADLQYEWALLDTHDMLTDFHKTLLTKNDLKSFLETLNFGAVQCEHGSNGIVCRCTTSE